MSKALYILISDGGDGSYYPQYTMNSELIAKLHDAYDEDRMDYCNGIACDGDGFHYDVIQVPDDSTPESLGISKYCFLSDDYADQFASEDEEDEE
jgi:hypothetical protein